MSKNKGGLRAALVAFGPSPGVLINRGKVSFTGGLCLLVHPMGSSDPFRNALMPEFPRGMPASPLKCYVPN